MAVTETIGKATIDQLAYIGDLARLSGRAAHAVFVGPFQGRPVRFGRAIHQAMAVGVEALPILSLISFFIGTILALQAAYELQRFGAMEFGRRLPQSAIGWISPSRSVTAARGR